MRSHTFKQAKSLIMGGKNAKALVTQKTYDKIKQWHTSLEFREFLAAKELVSKATVQLGTFEIIFFLGYVVEVRLRV